MKFSKKLVAFLLLIPLIFGSLSIRASAQVNYSPGDISASSACLIEAESGKVLYSKNSEKQLPMASTTKIMTAIIAIESGIPMDSVISVPREAIGIEGSSIYLRADEKITFEALLYGLLLSSANDAAIAIAISVADTVDDFVDLMNKKAASLGLANTHFTNPHGLYDRNHYTTASDMARLMSYCIKNELFTLISGCSKRIFRADESLSRVMINHNRLLKSNIGVIAGKTGYTKVSGRCLVTCAENENLRLIAVTLNAPNDWQDHKNLYKFGFSTYQRLYLERVSITLPVVSGNKKELSLTSSEISVVLPKDTHKITVTVKAPRFLFGGISKGEQLGTVIYKHENKVVATSSLIADETIEKTKYRVNPFEWLTDIIKGILKWKK